MGQAKRRKVEIEFLKQLGPHVDPASTNPEPTAEMARQLHALFEAARQDANIDPPVKFLYTKLGQTIQNFGQLPIACKKGCSHCCYIWVSATAPELLFIAKIIRSRGHEAIERVRSAHQKTAAFDFDTRGDHPTPCPLLDRDVCSIYESRPRSCRLAASADAEICARSYHGVTNEDIPTPALHLMGRTTYAIASAVALRQSNLPYHAYEFNSGLARALEVQDAEKLWLAGTDIFSDVMRDPSNIFDEPPTQWMFRHAFRNNP